MKLFECQYCGQLLYFDNTRCERCGHVLGYPPDRTMLSALTAKNGDRRRPLAALEESFHFCANAVYRPYNWMVRADKPGRFLAAPVGTTGRYPTLTHPRISCSGSTWRSPNTASSMGCCASACR